MSKQGWRVHLPKLVVGVVLLLVMTALVYMIKGFIDSADKPTKHKVQIISLVKPPEPKPPEVKPPEPVKQEIKEEVVLDQPVPEANNEPPPDMGSTLGPGNDGFGLAKGSGSGRIGGGGSRARWYAGLLGARIEQALNRDAKLLDELKTKRITVRIWVGSNGRVERVEWDKGAVPANSEQGLREQLLELTVQESPDGIEQPIWYRFRPRG
ncbi:hypothetical protein SCT_0102 [Sulfuricella sp. T08]|uniref:hypothetical protein n=1 Tax=Sulfuricella sp. T08 TaxID=1632857 RepID=UPI00061798CF|nr:hypothetical protein [Sulfuricella sp. T08]GAO34722.1 hypothetical protein SCT_0102 [Sulfuricella sp. T08]